MLRENYCHDLAGSWCSQGWAQDTASPLLFYILISRGSLQRVNGFLSLSFGPRTITRNLTYNGTRRLHGKHR